jgi:hypothetical protein
MRLDAFQGAGRFDRLGAGRIGGLLSRHRFGVPRAAV